MVLTSLLAIAFGAFGTNSNGGVLYHNTISFSSGVACVGTLKNSESYLGAFYEVKGSFDVDLYYVRDEEENTLNLAIKFNSGELGLWHYPENGNGEPTLVTFNSTGSYLDNFEDSELVDPNNRFGLVIEFSNQTTSSGTLTCYCDYYDSYADTSNGIYGTYSNVSLGSLITAKQSISYRVNFDLDDLVKQVENRMAADQDGFGYGYEQGYNTGYENGVGVGYNTGYSDGYTSGVQVDSTVFTIFNGILSVGMIPINVFLAMLDFTVLGINISNFVMSLLTVLITIWFVRLITGGGNKSD